MKQFDISESILVMTDPFLRIQHIIKRNFFVASAVMAYGSTNEAV